MLSGIECPQLPPSTMSLHAWLCACLHWLSVSPLHCRPAVHRSHVCSAKILTAEPICRPDTFSLGVCNGCQLMALLGWVPGKLSEPDASTSNGASEPAAPSFLDDGAQPRFVHNSSGRFESRWAHVTIQDSPSVLLKVLALLVSGSYPVEECRLGPFIVVANSLSVLITAQTSLQPYWLLPSCHCNQ